MPTSAASSPPPSSSVSPSSFNLSGSVFGRFTGRRQPQQQQQSRRQGRESPVPALPSSNQGLLRRPLHPNATDLSLPLQLPAPDDDTRALSASTHNLALTTTLSDSSSTPHTASKIDDSADLHSTSNPSSASPVTANSKNSSTNTPAGRRSSSTPTHSPAQSPSHSRRESTILSLATSVTDLGASVRRSVSLRSHRTNLSNSGSSASKAWSPASATSHNIFSPLTASPVGSPERTVPPQLPSAPPPAPPPDNSSAAPYPVVATRRKRSLSRNISQKFRSNENLVSSGQPARQNSEFTAVPPINTNLNPPIGLAAAIPTAPVSKAPRAQLSMLVGSIPHATALRRPEIPDRPSLHTQNSYSRDNAASSGMLHPPSQGSLTHSSTSLHPVPGGANPQIIYHQIQETSAKRIATIDYLRKVHEGDIFYFSTLHFLQSSFSSTMPSLYPHKLGRRATGYFMLGYSLPTLLDMNANSPLDMLKAFSALLQEFETYQSLSGFDASGNSLSRGRVGQMFKSGMGLGGLGGRGRRSSVATEGLALDTRQSDFLGLPRPSMNSTHTGGSVGVGSMSSATPTSATSTSASDYYASLSPSEPGPSPITPTNHDFTHLLLPHLCFEPEFHTTFATLCDSLVDAYAKLIELVSLAQASAEPCSPALSEAFSKADKSVRKILVANVVREFEDATRHGVKSEVAGLGKLVLGGLM